MIATEFKLIPLTVLVEHESAVRRRLDSLPVQYEKSMLDAPDVRCAFLGYVLLAHCPELLDDGYIKEVERIVGIIVSMFTSNGVAMKA